ncbi:unnamed protein product [Rhizoctonia solani]|uniref:Protein kinase domain-containing protein n=1 Tax=Rhizoctonia solani TaxID=456999 RepID=A0A8H2XF54_9AGAM|nr:unnamed protein product [Rhizoctonia solani]
MLDSVLSSVVVGIIYRPGKLWEGVMVEARTGGAIAGAILRDAKDWNNPSQPPQGRVFIPAGQITGCVPQQDREGQPLTQPQSFTDHADDVIVGSGASSFTQGQHSVTKKMFGAGINLSGYSYATSIDQRNPDLKPEEHKVQMNRDITMETGTNSCIGEEHSVAEDGNMHEENRDSSVISARGYGHNQVLGIYLTQKFVNATGPLEFWTRVFSDRPVVQLVEREKQAEVVLSVNATNGVTFMLRNQDSIRYGVHMLPAPQYFSVAPRIPDIMFILNALSRWNWYLGLMPSSRPFERAIDIEFCKLKSAPEYTDELGPVYGPGGPNLNVNGVVDIVANPQEYYGVRVLNRSTVDLYVYLLSFSATCLDIHQYKISTPDSSSSEPTLSRNAPLNIGYGSGGGNSLFVCTRPTELQSLEQLSPFERRGIVLDQIIMAIFEEKSYWDAFTMKIVQRRYPKEVGPTSTQLPEDSLPNLPHVLSSTMSIDEITALLHQHGCPDITAQLNLEECDNYPKVQGGSADIYCGWLRNGTKIAIKRSRARIPNDETGRTCLKVMAREGYTWSKHRHENILETLGVVRFHDGIALVAPWVDNGTVMDYIRIRPDTNRIKLCIEIARGLAYLHRVETTHGDLKGANVLVSRDGVAKLNDFGSTSMKYHTLQFTGGSTSRSYTLRWAAPELLGDDGPKSASADVYALGMTILEVITGKQPFEHIRGDLAVIGALSRGENPRRPESEISKASSQGDKLWDLLQLCWKAAPQDRPSAEDVVDVLSLLTPEGLRTHQ